VEYDLSAKQKKLSVCQRRPNVLLYQKEDHRIPHSNEEDVTGNLSETESLGESVGTNEETEEDGMNSASDRDEQLPRTVSGKLKTKRGRNERLMTPEEARAHLRRLFRNEATICSLLFGIHGPSASCGTKSHPSADVFFLDVLSVPPTRFRPPARIGETLFEHPQNELLVKALHTSYRLRDLQVDLRNASGRKAGANAAVLKGLQGKLLEALIQLQVDVNSFMDSSKNPAPTRQGKLPPAGVKQGLEKKEGLFRKHMMVRLDFTPRSMRIGLKVKQ
jgi:DNA-directed RNA polymerase beta' subunit